MFVNNPCYTECHKEHVRQIGEMLAKCTEQYVGNFKGAGVENEAHHITMNIVRLSRRVGKDRAAYWEQVKQIRCQACQGEVENGDCHRVHNLSRMHSGKSKGPRGRHFRQAAPSLGLEYWGEEMGKVRPEGGCSARLAGDTREGQ